MKAAANGDCGKCESILDMPGANVSGRAARGARERESNGCVER